MKRFIEGVDRGQSTLFPDRLGDWIGDDNAVRVVDVFVDELNLGDLGFGRVQPLSTGRPGYHPSLLLKLCIYGYVNRVQSSRRLEREAGRNVEVMWLTRRLVPDHKTIADFRKDNGPAIRKVCARFVALCRQLGLLAEACVAIDGSKFKAVNARDRNFTRAKMKRRMAQIEKSIGRYLDQLDSADRQEPSLGRTTKIDRLADTITKLREEMQRLEKLEVGMLGEPDQQLSLTDPDARSMATSGRGSGMVGYNVQAAVDTKHHLIVAHQVTNEGNDRAQLSTMATQTKAALETLVERQTRYVKLAKVANKETGTVVSALIRQARKLPTELYKSLTWDRGKELADHQRFSLATDIDVYFCVPQSLWQRGSNENTNGLLRQYFPKGTDLSVYSQAHLNKVARQLNERPRKTLGFETPAERFNACVASTG
jgi:IS30 family transposase